MLDDVRECQVPDRYIAVDSEGARLGRNIGRRRMPLAGTTSPRSSDVAKAFIRLARNLNSTTSPSGLTTN